MQLIESLVLGAVQGLTEFLPISSSAHLVLVPYFFNWTDPGLAYDVALHMGSLAAILMFFWRDWAAIIRDFFSRATFTRTGSTLQGVNWKLLIASTVPGVIAGLTLEEFAEKTLRNPILIACTLALFAIALWWTDRIARKDRDITSATLRDAIFVGLAQAMALVPGVSRSGITITAGLLLGFARPSAVRFSFLLSAPIIGGAGLLKANTIFAALSQGGPLAAAVVSGFVASLAASLLAIGLLSYIVKTRNFNVFVGYRLVLALVIIGVVILR